jgi:signal transduction histidine kinase
MPRTDPAEDLEAFRTRAFAKHVLFDMPFPVLGSIPPLVLVAWLMHGKVSGPALVGWSVFAAAVLVVRAGFDRHLRARFERGEGHAAALAGTALLAVPTGAMSGAFAWMYFDPNQPITMVILGTYMTVVIVAAILPTSVHLPIFYLLALPAHLPYVVQLLLSGGQEHYVVAGINLMFLIVTFGYAHAANRQYRETVRLRFENQHLIEDLEVRKEQAEEASRTKSLFLAGVSHDLKQPVRAIAMYAGALRLASASRVEFEQVALTAAKIETAVGSVHAQIHRLLELSRLESGAMPVQFESLRLADVFARVEESVSSLAVSRRVRLRFAIGRSQWVLADRGMLESILLNLVSNALQHAGGARVYVGTRRRVAPPDGHHLCIEVRDDGVGISDRVLPSLFEAYRSFDDRRSSESHGLGLAIARAQATHLGCDIEVRSRPGCGATFTVCGLEECQPERMPGT